jgi:hypothetical protein
MRRSCCWWLPSPFVGVALTRHADQSRQLYGKLRHCIFDLPDRVRGSRV